MKRFEIFFVLGLSLAAIPQDAAADVKPARLSDLVTLQGLSAGGIGGCAGSERNFNTRVMPDGTSQPFTIPAGQVLVLTGVEWFDSKVGLGKSVLQEVVLRRAGGPVVVYRSHSVSSVTDAGHAGQQSLIPKVVVSGGVPLCNAEYVDNQPKLPGPATLYGFLTKDQ
jgi:hypothetical protein